MSKKKLTKNQQLFKKEIDRIKRFIRSAEKRGYLFPSDIIPQLPKRVTKKRLEDIRELKPRKLYAKAEYVYQDTGEIVPAKVRQTEIRKEAAKKATLKRKAKVKKIEVPEPYVSRETLKKETTPYYPTISIIDKVRERLEDLQRFEHAAPLQIEQRKNELLRIYDDTVTLYSDEPEVLENYLKKHEQEIADKLDVIAYDSNGDKVNATFVQLGRLLNMDELSKAQAESLSNLTEFSFDLD